MPKVYLKNGETVEVSQEELEDYLYENSSRIETRKKNLRRPPTDSIVSSPSSK